MGDNKIDFSKVGIDDSFMFGYIMQNPVRCKAFLEQILNIKIDHIEYPEKEKMIGLSKVAHGIRLDIYVDDGKVVYNCEMQVKNTNNLPKRSRYYQGQIDLNLLSPGEDYNKLKRTYIIFICKFDLFGENRYIYSFENRCVEKLSLRLKDDSYKIFVNTKGYIGEVSEEFKELIHFLDTSEIKEYENELVNDLAVALVEARNDEKWRQEYMKFSELMNEKKEEGRTEGENLKLIEQVCKKMKKGKTLQEIVDELEESNKTIEKIYQAALKYNANLEDKEKIYKELI